MIDCVVAPVLHRYETAAELVKVTLLPAQKVVGPLAVIVGTAGSGNTVTVVVADTAGHPLISFTVTEYSPLLFTLMLWVVAPVLHS